jgi:gp16 family phage-associated protein
MYMDSTKLSTRTCAEAKAWLEAFGMPASEWAELNGFPKEIVYSVLSGRSRGLRGQAYEVAVELGIRARPPSNVASPRRIANSNENRPIDKIDFAGAPAGKDSNMSP